jgi:hypothetical protein
VTLCCGVGLGTGDNEMNRRVIHKATPCITIIQDLTVEVTYSLWEIMTNVYRTRACYTSGRSLVQLRNRQQWFCDFQSDLPSIFLSMIDQKVILRLIKHAIYFKFELTNMDLRLKFL